MPMMNTTSGGTHMYSTNGMPAPPLSVLRLSISRQVAPNMTPAATSGATTAESTCQLTLRRRGEVPDDRQRHQAHDARMPMLPIIGAQVPSLSSAPSVLES